LFGGTKFLEVVMKKLALIGTLLIVSLAARAAPEAIFVAYPPPNYEVGFDHVLLEGSVLPGATLTIDGKAVDTGTDGLFIEWLPLKAGLNAIKLESSLGAEKATQEFKVTSSPASSLPSAPTKIVADSIDPYNETVFYSNLGQNITVAFVGSPGGEASFKLGDKGPFKMLERKPQDFAGVGDPASEGAKLATAGRYEGSYQLQPGDSFNSSPITITLKGTDGSTVTAVAPAKLSLKNVQPRVGMYTATPLVGISQSAEVARNGQGHAYILFPRNGMKFLVVGEEGNTYQARVASGQFVNVRKDKMRLLDEGAPFPKHYFTTIRTKRVEGATEVRFELPDLVPYSVDQNSSTASQSLEMRLYYTESDVDYMIFAHPDPLVRDIKWRQEADGVFAANIDLAGRQQWGYKVYYEGSTLVVRLKDAPKINRSRPLEGRKITIDPGHGGEDTGGAGPLRVPEKDIVLAIGLKLEAMLKAKGATVTMTRKTDLEIPLPERSAINDKSGGDVFVSIHANALPDGANPANSRGSGVYFFQPQSRALANSLLDALLKAAPEMGNDGVHYQNLAVARPTLTPQVLIETGFLTDKTNLRLLMSEAGQNKLAAGVAAGLEQFFKDAATP
jgi:N-acetylmuramoyl-L-alanine amidase